MSDECKTVSVQGGVDVRGQPARARAWVGIFLSLRVRSLMTETASDMNFAGFRFSVGLPFPDGRALILTAIISMQTTIIILATAGRKKMCISEHMFP